MSNELTTQEKASLTIWDDEKQFQEIKKMYGKDLSEGEFMLFVQTGKAMNLNPFLRQIWAVKYGNSPAQIFVGRDGYLVNAMRHPQYNGLISTAYYSNDIMKRLPDGTLHHESNYNNRGRLMGAYAIVYRKDLDFPIVKEVLLSEYNTGKSNWSKMPETMIKKVAEAQALRFAFPEMFAGTWHEAEQWDRNETKTTRTSSVKIGKPRPKPVEPQPEPIQDAEYEIDETTGEAIEQAPVNNEKALLMLTDEAVNLNPENVEKYKAKCMELIRFDYPDEFTDIEILRELYRFVKQLIKEQ
jgi:phage recombination protein Bet